MAADNKTLAKFELAPIPPAPRGVPQIEVSFDIDANGIVHVQAKDLGTGKSQSVRVVASSGLDKAQIEQMIAEAEQFRQTDEKRKELAEIRTEAQALLYTSERAAEECKDLVAPEIIAQVQAAAAELRGLVDGAGDAVALREAMQRLEISAYKIAESMYGSG
jgi:molecular chaperone DnaK